MQDLLAVAGNYRHWTANLRYAAQLAAARDGALTGIFVCEPILPPPSMNSALAIPQMVAIAEDIVREARAAEPDFLRWAAEFGLGQARWVVAEGTLEQALANAANWHDALVLEAGGDSPIGLVGTLGHILLTCGTPCFVVPQAHAKPAALNTIAVAWNGSAESVRALHAALPLLRDARRIVLIEGKREQPPFSAVEWQPPLGLDAFLAGHRLEVDRVPLHSDDAASGAELLRIAGEERADLLVMGAYGRTRFSEWVLGGATRHVLEHGTIPLFMRH